MLIRHAMMTTKKTTGECFYVNGNFAAWMSKKQN
jgi:hypothetical protein